VIGYVETVEDLPKDAEVLDYCWVNQPGRTYRYDLGGWVPVSHEPEGGEILCW
jgi:hypothetical protein